MSRESDSVSFQNYSTKISMMKQERLMNGPMKKITEVSKGDVTMPENIDFSAAMDKLGIE